MTAGLDFGALLEEWDAQTTVDLQIGVEMSLLYGHAQQKRNRMYILLIKGVLITSVSWYTLDVLQAQLQG